MRNDRSNRVLLAFLLLIGIGVMTLLSRPRSQAGGFTPVAARKPMPSLVMSELNGGTWRLADHRGEVVLINYWATWCGPCRQEMPGLVEVAKAAEPEGLAVVGVSLDNGDLSVVKPFVDRYQVSYPIAFPESMSQMSSGMEGIPTTILVDRSGLVVKTYVGAVRREDLASDVQEVLAEPVAGL